MTWELFRSIAQIVKAEPRVLASAVGLARFGAVGPILGQRGPPLSCPDILRSGPPCQGSILVA